MLSYHGHAPRFISTRDTVLRILHLPTREAERRQPPTPRSPLAFSFMRSYIRCRHTPFMRYALPSSPLIAMLVTIISDSEILR